MSGNFFKGTSSEQDARFEDKQRKLILSKEWPQVFEQRVDMKKIDLEIIKPWVGQRVQFYIGIDDEIVQKQIINFLEQQQNELKGPDPRELSILLTGYFEQGTIPFMIELWNLLLETQASPNGVAGQIWYSKQQELLEKKAQLDGLRQKLQSMDKASKQRRTKR